MPLQTKKKVCEMVKNEKCLKELSFINVSNTVCKSPGRSINFSLY